MAQLKISEGDYEKLLENLGQKIKTEVGPIAEDAAIAVAVPGGGWIAQAFKWSIRLWLAAELWEKVRHLWTQIAVTATIASGQLWPARVAKAMKAVHTTLDSSFPTVLGFTAAVVEKAFGNTVDTSALLDETIDTDPAAAFSGVGHSLWQMLSRVMPESAVRDDFAGRESDTASFANLDRFLGASMTLGIRSAAAELSTDALLIDGLKPFQRLDEILVHSLGFNRVLSAIVREEANERIVRGMKRSFNRHVKPVDYTQHQALQARARGLIDDTLLGQVLDNEGVRLDVRAPLLDMAHTGYSESQAARAYVEGRIDSAGYGAALDRHAVLPGIRSTLADMAEKDLSHASLQDLWEWGAVTHEDLKQHLRWQGYRESRATIEADLIELKRSRHLIDEKVASARRLFRDCVLQEGELRQYLSEAHYSAAEQTLVVEVELLARRQRTFMSVPDMVKAATLGLTTLPEIATQLQCRGYTPADTIAEIILKLQKELPQCAQVALKDDAAIAALQALGLNLGVVGGTLPVALLAFLQCLSGATVLLAPVVNAFTVTPAVVPFMGIAVLSWEVTGAAKISISGIGEVPATGSTEYEFREPRGFILTAENPAGKTTAYVFVRVETPLLTVVPVVVSSISPASGPAAGGTALTITGSGFTGATSVLVNFAPLVGMTVLSDTQITGVTPPGTGFGDVRVLGPGGESATSAADVFTYV